MFVAAFFLLSSIVLKVDYMESLVVWMKTTRIHPYNQRIAASGGISWVALVADGTCAATCEALDIHEAVVSFALERMNTIFSNQCLVDRRR
jgi:hypothetical protein